MRKTDKVLVLNADYTALAVEPWQVAILRVFKNKEDENDGAEVVDYYPEYVSTCGGKKIPMPAVVRLVKYIRPKSKPPSFSRRNVFMRDELSCAYCGKISESGIDLTLDHIQPRSKWDKKTTPTCWENVITACRRCNHRKGDRTPEEASMPLLRKPTVPKHKTYVKNLSPWNFISEQWMPYLPTQYKVIAKKYY